MLLCLSVVLLPCLSQHLLKDCSCIHMYVYHIVTRELVHATTNLHVHMYLHRILQLTLFTLLT